MTESLIRSECSAGVLAITLARAQKKNALTAAMYQQLSRALQAAADDHTVHVVLLGADGDDFCAGNDIADFIAMASGGRFEDAPVLQFLRALITFDKPVVAGVCGRAVGIGLTLLLHCDLVYVARDARLSAPFVDLAVVPEAASSRLLPQRLGHPAAFALFALGESLDGEAAVRAGLANQALPAAQVRARALEAAQVLAVKPLRSLRATKQLMRDQDALIGTMEAEAREFADRLRSPEAQAVFKQFLERRGPG